MSGGMIGWAHTKFGKLEDQDLESLIATTAAEAIRGASVGPSDIGSIYVGNFGGFQKQGFPSSFALNADPSLRF